MAPKLPGFPAATAAFNCWPSQEARPGGPRPLRASYPQLGASAIIHTDKDCAATSMCYKAGHSSGVAPLRHFNCSGRKFLLLKMGPHVQRAQLGQGRAPPQQAAAHMLPHTTLGAGAAWPRQLPAAHRLAPHACYRSIPLYAVPTTAATSTAVPFTTNPKASCLNARQLQPSAVQPQKTCRCPLLQRLR
jgi:hypothetical protein